MVVTSNNNRFRVVVRYILIPIKMEFVIRHVPKEVLALYMIKKGKEKRITTLRELFLKLKKGQTKGMTLANMLSLVVYPKRREKQKGTLVYLNKKTAYRARIRLTIGVDDAYATAMVCGFIVSVAGALCAAFNNQTHVVWVDVTPQFSKPVFSIDTDCIIKVTPANIIIGYFIYQKNKRR